MNADEKIVQERRLELLTKELEEAREHRNLIIGERTEAQRARASAEQCLSETRAALVKANSDLTDANHKALNYKSQRDQALRDNARLRGLLTLLADNIKASANTCGALEAMAHDLPATAPEKEGG